MMMNEDSLREKKSSARRTAQEDAGGQHEEDIPSVESLSGTFKDHEEVCSCASG